MNGLKCLSRTSGVAIVETSCQREFNNHSHLWRLNGPPFRGIFAKPSVSPGAGVILPGSLSRSFAESKAAPLA
jgi:hypothetical protein